MTGQTGVGGGARRFAASDVNSLLAAAAARRTRKCEGSNMILMGCPNTIRSGSTAENGFGEMHESIESSKAATARVMQL